MKTISSERGGSRLSKALVLFIILSFISAPVSPVFLQKSLALQEENSITEQPLPDQTDEAVTEQEPDPTLDTNTDETMGEGNSLMSLNSVITPTGSLTEIGDVNKNHLSPEIDSTTGGLVYKYDIQVPPGRNEMTPDVSLVYNSANAIHDSVVGSGWEINIPYIQRVNKDGSNNLYSSSYYVSSMDGELVSMGSGVYAAKNENGEFLTYTLSSGVWTVTDKKGTVYKFGTTTDSRQDNPSDNTQIFKWMLEETRDTNNNYITYEYFKDGGQIYPLTITYTGNGTTAGIFEVNFVHTSRSTAPSLNDTGFPVTSNYTITEIRTEINNTWAKKYTLEYTTGDNGYGSLLDSIVESGQDDSSNVITLPETNFDYTNTVSNTDWAYNSSLTIALPFLDGITDYGMRTADINGDGLLDVVCHNENTNGHCNKNDPEIYLNTGSGWTNVSGSWLFPVKVDDSTRREAFVGSTGQDLGLRLVDVNGDLKTDLVRAMGTTKYVYLNTGSGWTYSSSWSFPSLGFLDGGADYGFRMGDINGDGLPDVICHNENTNGHCNKNNPEVYLNNGSGWTDVSGSWHFPVKVDDSTRTEAFISSGGQDLGLRLVDVNGDGLGDLVRGKGSAKYVYLNNGSGWTYNSSWAFPLQGFVDSSGQDYGLRMADINGDNLPDILCHNEMTNGTCSKNNAEIYMNTGSGWTQSGTWGFPVKAYDSTKTEVFLNSSLQDAGLRVMDINGDGIDDLVKAVSFSNKYVYPTNNTIQTNLLSAITYPQGGDTAITYKATPLFLDGSSNPLNPAMPVIFDVVLQTTTDDGFGTTMINDYEYQGGEYYFNTYLDRKFAGFSKIIKTDAAGNKTVQFYHQGNGTDSSHGEYSDNGSKIGKIYRTEVQDSSGNVYSKTINKWDTYNIGTGHYFVKLVQTVELTYDGDSDHKDTATTYTYSNTTGNVTDKVEYGEVTGTDAGTFTDTGTDTATTTISYASNTGAHIIGLPSQETTVDYGSSKVRENKYYYDGQTLGNVNDGNLTKQEMWKDSTNYVDIEKTYNTTYGIVTQEKDQRDKTTDYSYDSYYLYPTTVTNALSQATAYTYDYSLGKPKTTTDPNSRVYEKIYDGLGRVLTEKQPDLASPTTLVNKTTYAYTDTSGAVKVIKTDYLDGSTDVVTYTYYDGLGRPIQTRKEMESGNYAVADMIYNNRGLLYKESLPYSSIGTSKTITTTDADLLTVYTYDPIARVTSVVNTVGTTSNAYDDWKTTVTDPRSKVKNFYSDAYGNLVKVEETNSGSTYTTNYEWNLNKKLTKITDALSNVRNFTYDGLGRRLTAQDLHASADTTFGSWSYLYDDAGNMTQSISPEAKTVNYTYDDLNRVLTENYTGATGTEITYVYDTGTDGIGKLYSVTMTAGANTVYTYNANGAEASEVKTINSNAYTTSYTYDRQGNILVITYPDSAEVKYTWNTAGLLEKIERKESGGSYTDVVSDFDYAPNEKLILQSDANGVTTTNTYDATALYRLTNRLTQKSGGPKLQDLNYTYDNNGNITQIVDASNTDSSKTVAYVYDDLNRLTSATATSVAAGQSTYTHTFTYSKIGNILTSPVGSYSYNGDKGSSYANPHAATSIAGGAQTYDKDGNLLTYGLNTNTWNYKDQLTNMSFSTTTLDYSYDHAGNRTRFIKNSSLNTYYPNKYYTVDPSGTQRKHIYAGDQLVATIETTGGTVTPYYDHVDHLNSINVATDSGGSQQELLDYFPYGSQRISSGAYTAQRQYIGQTYDTDSSLSYLNARYYNGSVGRFLSQDAVFVALGNGEEIQKLTQIEQNKVLEDPQSLNSYSYARNNPISLSDPEGKFVILGPVAASIVTAAFKATAAALTYIKVGEITVQSYYEVKHDVPYDRKTMTGDLIQVGLAPVSRGVGALLGTAKEAQQLKVLFQTIDAVEVLDAIPQAVGDAYSNVKSFFKNEESTSSSSTNQSTIPKSDISSDRQNKVKKDR